VTVSVIAISLLEMAASDSPQVEEYALQA